MKLQSGPDRTLRRDECGAVLAKLNQTFSLYRREHFEMISNAKFNAFFYIYVNVNFIQKSQTHFLNHAVLFSKMKTLKIFFK